ncbi:hypothetical protein [Massilia sp. SYSU DXS3249]
MRFIPFALLASAALCAQAAPGFGRPVDLDAPGALERVRQDKPAHAHAIARILREAPQRKPQAIAGWVRTAFDARMASAMLVKTSYPPQARLEFTLEDTAYRATVTLRNVEPAMHPADGR